MVKIKQLKDLRNVGPACIKDLNLLDIHSVEALSKQDPTDLFHRLERATESYQDPCVWGCICSNHP